MSTTTKCHGCEGKGWVQVTSPTVGKVEALLCPVCNGSGERLPVVFVPVVPFPNPHDDGNQWGGGHHHTTLID